MNDLKEHFENLTEGDKVWVEHRNGWSVEKFSRTTKTLLVTVNRFGQEVRYNIDSGFKKGLGKWEYVKALPFTDKHENIVAKHQLKNSILEELDYIKNKLSEDAFYCKDTLQQVFDTLKEMNSEN